jgi:hypothetical protein
VGENFKSHEMAKATKIVNPEGSTQVNVDPLKAIEDRWPWTRSSNTELLKDPELR